MGKTNCLKPILLSMLMLSFIFQTYGQDASLERLPIKIFEVKAGNSGLFIPVELDSQWYGISINGVDHTFFSTNHKVHLDIQPGYKGSLYFFHDADNLALYHISQKNDLPVRIRRIPLWLSLLPPFVAIILALLFKEVLISLFAGIWTGAFIAGGLRFESFLYYFESFFTVVTHYILNALTHADHISIIVFTLLIGGMVAIISKNGGMAGVVHSLSKYAKSKRSSAFITWLLGIAIFFDDYANTLIVGNTMRPVTDRFKISREKLAYIVDSTAAPVAAIAFITTWIGAELGYIADGIDTLGLQATPYALFLESLKYSYYPILTLFFVALIIISKKDYGAMYIAEERASTTGNVSGTIGSEEGHIKLEDLSPVKGAPIRWLHAVLPVLTVILVTIIGLVQTGMESAYTSIVEGTIEIGQSWSAVWQNLYLITPSDQPGFFSKLGFIIGESNSFVALLWASMSGVLVAIILTLKNRIMNLFDTMHWLIAGFKTMIPALLILTLAWSLAITTKELHTAEYLSKILSGNLHPFAIPALVFVLSALIAFSTGSSWSTMAILYPIAIPIAYAVCQSAGFDHEMTMNVILNVIATVLAASVLGDHCSPISDTTILSSLASDCNHIDHVRTQLPYALTVGAASLACLMVATWIGGSWWMNILILLAGMGVLILIVYKWGKQY
ncbi:MAG TPA: Na+/H+ antiporter NhaC family protein [Saprospiraceae bacterium]|nr:Na+/H+ antiporter NhaC family protein [Saprospiraceae bacterium]